MSARSSNTVSRNEGQGNHKHHFTHVIHTSRHSIGAEKSDLVYTQNWKNTTNLIKTARSASRQLELKTEPGLDVAMSQVSARTFQAFLSKRFHNFELAYLITLISSMYEDSIQLNGSHTDLLFKGNWDEIAKQMFNAARIIRSLTKLKYSASADPKSEFIQKLQKIQYHKKFEQLQRRIDQDQEDLANQLDGFTRKDYS